MFASKANLYKILESTEKSDLNHLKKKFYKLSQVYHPDVKGGSAEKFIELKQAYEILSNPTLRSEYDQQQSINSVTKSRSQRYRTHSQGLNPNAYILYRNKENTKHGFNYEKHFKEHYAKQRHNSLYYKELYERKQLKPFRLFLLGGFALMLYFSDLIQVLFVR